MTESFLRFGFARKLTALPPFLHRRQNSANGPTTCGALSFAEVFRQLIEKSSVHRSSIQAGVILWLSQSSEGKEEEPLLRLSSLNERDCHTSYDSRGETSAKASRTPNQFEGHVRKLPAKARPLGKYHRLPYANLFATVCNFGQNVAFHVACRNLLTSLE
jgi:hypothetical protein